MSGRQAQDVDGDWFKLSVQIGSHTASWSPAHAPEQLRSKAIHLAELPSTILAKKERCYNRSRRRGRSTLRWLLFCSLCFCVNVHIYTLCFLGFFPVLGRSALLRLTFLGNLWRRPVRQILLGQIGGRFLLSC